MQRTLILSLLLLFLTTRTFAQTDVTSVQPMPDIFEKIAKSVVDFRLDTTAAPDDKITRKIKELRVLKGGFNISEALDFKLQEDKQKGEIPAAQMTQLSDFFQKGNGKKWLENAVIWIYRKHFTYNELKQLVKFYKTTTGQKLATDFPIIMMQSLRAAEMIKELYVQQK